MSAQSSGGSDGRWEDGDAELGEESRGARAAISMSASVSGALVRCVAALVLVLGVLVLVLFCCAG